MSTKMSQPPIDQLFSGVHLTYRALNDTPADLILLHKIQSDIAAFSASDFRLLKPWSRAQTRNMMEQCLDADKNLICVVVCLNAGLSAAHLKKTASGEKDKDSGGKKEDEWATAEDNLVPIGWVGLTAPRAPHRSSYISIDILKPFRGNGYGGEGINWVLDWGFRTAGLHRIGIEHFEHNEGAGRLYRKLGFKEEGMERESCWYNGGWWGVWKLGMLVGEWEALRMEEDGKGRGVVVGR